MAKLFNRERNVITKHINNVFKTGELDEKSNVQKMHIAMDARMNVIFLKFWTMNMDKKENKGEIVIYRTDDGKSGIDVRLEDQTYGLLRNKWLSCS